MPGPDLFAVDVAQAREVLADALREVEAQHRAHGVYPHMPLGHFGRDFIERGSRLTEALGRMHDCERAHLDATAESFVQAQRTLEQFIAQDSAGAGDFVGQLAQAAFGGVSGGGQSGKWIR